MKADQVIQRAFLAANRKAIPPVVGSTKYAVLLGILDNKQKDWASEPGTEWDSLRQSNYSIGTASSSTTYDLPDEVQYVSKEEGDPVLVGTTPYLIVRPNQLYRYRDSQVCAQNGRTITFPTSSLTPYVGKTITIPAVLAVPDIKKGTDTVVVDDPMWLVYSVAAEFVRNDVVKSNQYDNLLAQANEHMDRMKENNQGSLEEIERSWRPEGVTWR